MLVTSKSLRRTLLIPVLSARPLKPSPYRSSILGSLGHPSRGVPATHRTVLRFRRSPLCPCCVRSSLCQRVTPRLSKSADRRTCAGSGRSSVFQPMANPTSNITAATSQQERPGCLRQVARAIAGTPLSCIGAGGGRVRGRGGVQRRSMSSRDAASCDSRRLTSCFSLSSSCLSLSASCLSLSASAVRSVSRVCRVGPR